MRIKSFVAGFLLACFLITGLYASADSGFVRQVTAIVGGVDIVLDGVKLFPRDADGKPVLPMIIDGTTYVPIRYLTVAMNKKMTMDGNTLYFGNEQQIKAIFLSELTPVLKSRNWTDYGLMGGWIRTEYDSRHARTSYSKSGIMRIAGKEYMSVSTILTDGLTPTWGLYTLGGRYARLTGYFGVDDASTGIKCTGELEIIGDGITLKRITQYKGHAPEYFDVDIKGVDILTIKVSGESITETVNGQVLPTQQTVCDVFDIKLHY